MSGERIQIPLKAGHHRPASATPFNGVSLAGRWWPNIECWHGTFVIWQEIRTSIAKEPYSFVIFQRCMREGVRTPPPPPPLWTHAWNSWMQIRINIMSILIWVVLTLFVLVITRRHACLMLESRGSGVEVGVDNDVGFFCFLSLTCFTEGRTDRPVCF